MRLVNLADEARAELEELIELARPKTVRTQEDHQPMPIDPTGTQNVTEFHSHRYLDALLEHVTLLETLGYPHDFGVQYA
jgi:hypothetical protein